MMFKYNKNKYIQMDSHKNWIPQWRLDKEKQEKEEAIKAVKDLENTEANFPVLSKSAVSTKKWIGKSFKSLASEWKDYADNEKFEEDQMKAIIDIDNQSHFVFVLPKFDNNHRYEEEEEESPKKEVNEFEWTVVDRTKVRKVRDMDEYLNRPPTPEDDGTVWKETELHETCWEERH